VLAAQAEAAVAVSTGHAAAGEEPIDYMLKIMRDPSVEPARRDAMAKAAAPYRHPQLQAVAHKLVDSAGNPLAPVINLTVSTPPSKPGSARLFAGGDMISRRNALLVGIGLAGIAVYAKNLLH
jgi:hypothetical protein